jgi:uncharacterized membrane protein YgcG
MKKLFVIVLGFVLLLGPVTPARANVNDFEITDYQIDYYLGRDADGRSTLKTVEKITAEFPQIDQNHGIERAIPLRNDDHDLSLDIQSVTDGSGNDLNYTTYESNGNEVVRIGEADRYVHGSNTYVLIYTQRDVTRYYADTNSDEFYWDTNGTDWRVPIRSLNVKLHVEDSIASALNTTTACYQGVAGSSDACEVVRSGNEFSVVATDLSAGENVTLAVGFAPQTFAGYQPSLWEQFFALWVVFVSVVSIVSFGILGWLILRWTQLNNRKKELGTIIPQYIPPRDASVTASAEVIDSPRGVMTAQLLDLAVRHYIRIIQTKEKSLFKVAEYDIEIIKPIDKLKWEEQELLRDMFDGSVAVGSTMSMKTMQSSTAFYLRSQNNAKDITKLVQGEYGLRAKDVAVRKWFKRAGKILLVVGVVTLSPFTLIAAVTSFILASMSWPLTDKGLDLRRYLMGLKLYIEVAETERLAMLQSPEGAEKVGEPVDANNQTQIIKLYEKVLPYAVLFGQEKQWNEQLGKFYESTGKQPDWYSGTTAFNAASFSAGMSSFSSSTSYATPSGSSSGGSSGGGSSGGGGGGGGGGGW